MLVRSKRVRKFVDLGGGVRQDTTCPIDKLTGSTSALVSLDSDVLFAGGRKIGTFGFGHGSQFTHGACRLTQTRVVHPIDSADRTKTRRVDGNAVTGRDQTPTIERIEMPNRVFTVESDHVPRSINFNGQATIIAVIDVFVASSRFVGLVVDGFLPSGWLHHPKPTEVAELCNRSVIGRLTLRQSSGSWATGEAGTGIVKSQNFGLPRRLSQSRRVFVSFGDR